MTMTLAASRQMSFPLCSFMFYVNSQVGRCSHVMWVGYIGFSLVTRQLTGNSHSLINENGKSFASFQKKR